MKNFDPTAQFLQGLQRLNIPVTQAGIDRLIRYFHELRKWGRQINLVGKKADGRQIVENHFLDSLTLLPSLAGAKSHLLDIGTGAGFPGLACRAVMDDLQLTLVEPRKKRVDFLLHMIRTLGLDDVRVLECRIEDEKMIPSDGDFTHITSRGVAEIDILLKMAERFAVIRPKLICMKGPRWKEEIDSCKEFPGSSPYTLSEVVTHRLPFSGAERALLLFETIEK